MIVLEESLPQHNLPQKLLKYFLSFLKCQNKQKILIDLKTANEAVKDFRNGFQPFFLQKKENKQLNVLRKDLIKKRYFHILESEQKLKANKSTIQQTSIAIKQVQTYDYESELRSIHRLALRKTSLQIYSPQYKQVKNKNQKQYQQLEEHKQRKIVQIQTQVKNRDKWNQVEDQKNTLKKNTKSQRDSKAEKNEDKIDRVQNKEENKEIEDKQRQRKQKNPFLCSMNKKVDLSEIITELNTNNGQQKIFSSFSGKNNHQNLNYHSNEHSTIQPSTYNTMNMFPSFHDNNVPQNNVVKQNFISPQKSSVAMFLPQHNMDNNSNSLFGGQQAAPTNNNRSRDRKKKKNEAARIYQ